MFAAIMKVILAATVIALVGTLLQTLKTAKAKAESSNE